MTSCLSGKASLAILKGALLANAREGRLRAGYTSKRLQTHAHRSLHQRQTVHHISQPLLLTSTLTNYLRFLL
eukprot:6134145-Amphidinium_carterae.2